MSARNLFDLTGKVALITGGSRGLGLQMAKALGDMGARVAITARKADELAEAKTQLTARGIDVLTVTNDLARPEGIPAPAEDYPPEAWHKVMNLNVNAMFFLSQYVGKHVMIPKKSGKIINISSVAGLAGNPPGMATIAYNTSKGADINFTRALAAEWGKYNINVNAICPGFFPSKMSEGLLGKLEKMVIAMTPLQRIGGDEDLMGTVVFLASEASRHITGQYLVVDGGASCC